MKKLSSFSAFFFVVLFSCSVFAQQPKLLMDNFTQSSQVKKAIDYKRIAKRAFNQVLTTLDSKIQGTVEATIFVAIEEKYYYPSADYTEMIDRLNRIAEENPDPSVRVKAHLAGIYLSASDIIDVKPNLNTYDQGYIFKQIIDQLENKALAYK